MSRQKHKSTETHAHEKTGKNYTHGHTQTDAHKKHRLSYTHKSTHTKTYTNPHTDKHKRIKTNTQQPRTHYHRHIQAQTPDNIYTHKPHTPKNTRK